LLKRHHDDILTDHFDVKKIIELFNKKYHWSRMIKYVKFYIKKCDVCQRTKTFKHFFYDDLQSFFLFQNSWQKIIMKFIINFSFNKRLNDVYDFVLVIINRYIKITFYIFVTKKITIVELTRLYSIMWCLNTTLQKTLSRTNNSFLRTHIEQTFVITWRLKND
jgi:hypothetical protein